MISYHFIEGIPLRKHTCQDHGGFVHHVIKEKY